MECAHCQGVEKEFDSRLAQRELREYRSRGPGETARLLVDALKSAGVHGSTLLDIGGGVGVLQNELLNAGARQAIAVEASSAYIHAARAEAERQGNAARITYRHGNFVDLAPQLPPTDLVTLEKVICCYPDVRNLVSLSSNLAVKLYAFVIPRDTWWIKVANVFSNLYYRLRRSSFRGYVHPTALVDALLRANGFERRYYRRTFIWQVMVYSRGRASAVPGKPG